MLADVTLLRPLGTGDFGVAERLRVAVVPLCQHSDRGRLSPAQRVATLDGLPALEALAGQWKARNP